MKNIFLLLIIAGFATVKSEAQSFAINTDGSTANSSALFDVKSTAKGVLIPRMSKAERNAIVSPATGLLIFQNAPDSAGFYYYDGSKWNWIASLNGNADTVSWKRSGNAGTNPAVNFMGTIDNQPLHFRQNNSWIGKWNSATNNYAVGAGAGENNSSGVNNVTIGDSAGNASTAASHNVLIGTNAGLANTGSWATLIGTDAGRRNQAFGNVFIGSAAGTQNTTGFQNTFIGDNAGRDNSTGRDNSFFGAYTGQFTSGSENSFFGSLSGLQNTVGAFNSFLGNQAGGSNTSGNYNTFLGTRAGYSNVAGSGSVAIGNAASYTLSGGGSILNVAVGDSAGYANTASENTFIGGRAGRNNTTGGSNIFVGTKTGFSNTTGSSNIFLGKNAGYNNTTGRGSIAIGNAALFSMSGGPTQYNIAIGDSALYATTNYTLFGYMRNIAVGNSAGRNNVNGVENTFIGARAGYSNDSSIRNSFVGADAGMSIRSTFNGYNSFFGALAGGLMTEGQGNCIFGATAANDKISGDNNVYMGYQAGYNDSSGNRNVFIGSYSGTINLSGNNNTLIGHQTNLLTGTLTNATAIGAHARVDENNALVLGSISGINGAVVNTNVGIGTSVPTRARLTVSANNALSGSTLAIFGFNQAGISFQQNNPTIGYNQYRDISAGNATRYMGNGFAWVNNMDQAVGNMYWSSMPSGTANAVGGTETLRMTLTNTGSLGLNVVPNGNGQMQFQNTLDNRKIVMWETVNNATDFFGFGINSGTLRYQIPAGGNVHRFYAGNTLLFTLFGNGDAVLTGFLTTASDARLKKNIIPVKSAVSDLKKLNAYTYNWKDENKNPGQQIGLLAQEVEKVYPQLIKKDTAGIMSVNYSGFVPLLIKGMQEQQQTIEDIQQQVKLLKEQNKLLLQLVKEKK